MTNNEPNPADYEAFRDRAELKRRIRRRRQFLDDAAEIERMEAEGNPPKGEHDSTDDRSAAD